MTAGKLVLPDEADRQNARANYESSQMVEASAGTGKTTTLVDRIVCMLREGGRRVSEIAAMTFTEKAAGEMKVRLRETLDEAIAKMGAAREASKHADAQEAEELRNLEEARRDLESAEIATIHSFCARLLREQPVAAGVDPDFIATDATRAGAMLSDAFAAWLDREARKEGSPAARALLSGASPAAILELAQQLQRGRSLLDGTRLPCDPLAAARVELRALLARFDAALAEVPPDRKGDAKALQVAQGQGELRRLAALPLDELVAWRPVTLFNFSAGGRNAFEPEVKAKLHACKEAFKALPARLSTLPLEGLLADLVTVLRDDLVAGIEEEKRRLGLLDFDDLLLVARDLLRGSEAIRGYFRERFKTLVVDEFQDTDPVQAEIVMRLASGEPQDPVAWRDLVPDPGSLFIVGDPKQSIYRFRRADVESYREVRERFDPGERLSLRTNFRSDPRLLTYVNTLLEGVMVEKSDAPWEIGYAPLEPNPGRARSSLKRPVLHLLPPPAGEGPGREAPRPADGEEVEEGEDLTLVEQEARAIARLLLDIHGQFPCASWNDIGVVVRRNEAIDRYQEVFREAGIPAVLEGGRSFYRREETAAVTAALRAIDDPADSISTVAALKSFLFGLDDLELLEAVEAGGRFDVWETIPPESPAGEALALLSGLHALRHRRPAAETLAHLLAARQAACAMEAGAVVNAVQGAANLERLGALARDLDREGLSFREVVLRLAEKLDTPEGEPRAFADDVEAVKLITIHKSKGLEFQVVVLADLGSQRVAKAPTLFYDREGGEFGVALAFRGRSVRTPGAARLLDAFQKRARAEEKRFLYVGLTRAREMLVVSWFRKLGVTKSGPSDGIGRTLLAPIARFERPEAPLAEIVGLVEGDVRPLPRPAGPPAEVAAVDLAGRMSEAEALLEKARATASRPLRRAGEAAPSDAPFPEDLAPVDREGEAAGRAVRIGVAVHETMELHLDPDRGLPLDEAIDAAGRALPADERSEVTRLARRLASHEVTRRALAARRRFVELPILFTEEAPDAPLVEGKIDLLFEEEDGFVVVDWKTDRVDTEVRRTVREEMYRPQLQAYADGLARLLGPAARVKETHLVFAREP